MNDILAGLSHFGMRCLVILSLPGFETAGPSSWQFSLVPQNFLQLQLFESDREILPWTLPAAGFVSRFSFSMVNDNLDFYATDLQLSHVQRSG